MKTKQLTINVFLSLAFFLTLAGTAWAAPCGDTAGAGPNKVPCSCGDTVMTTTTLVSPALNPVNGDPVVSTTGTDRCPGDRLFVNATINVCII